jgi:hypothetical protein
VKLFTRRVLCGLGWGERERERESWGREKKTRLDVNERKGLAEVFELRSFAPGSVIIKQGQSNDSLFLVMTGEAIAVQIGLFLFFCFFLLIISFLFCSFSLSSVFLVFVDFSKFLLCVKP